MFLSMGEGGGGGVIEVIMNSIYYLASLLRPHIRPGRHVRPDLNNVRRLGACVSMMNISRDTDA